MQTCLVCHKDFKILNSFHLRSHSLSMKEYEQKFGISLVSNWKDKKRSSEYCKAVSGKLKEGWTKRKLDLTWCAKRSAKLSKSHTKTPKKCVLCDVCKKEYIVVGCKSKQKHFFCSKACQGLWMRVHPTLTAWNKGIFGYSITPWTFESRKKASATKQGVALVDWKGFTPSNAGDISRRTPEYRQWRRAVFERDNYTCQVCTKRGGKLNADHIKPFSLYPELRFDISNGRTLCEDCHRKTETYAGKCFNLKKVLCVKA